MMKLVLCAALSLGVGACSMLEGASEVIGPPVHVAAEKAGEADRHAIEVARQPDGSIDWTVYLAAFAAALVGYDARRKAASAARQLSSQLDQLAEAGEVENPQEAGAAIAARLRAVEQALKELAIKPQA